MKTRLYLCLCVTILGCAAAPCLCAATPQNLGVDVNGQGAELAEPLAVDTWHTVTAKYQYAGDLGLLNSTYLVVCRGGNQLSGFYIGYDVPKNELAIVKHGFWNATEAIGTPGAPGIIIENDQGYLDCENTRIDKTADVLTVTYRVKFKPNVLKGTYNVFFYVDDKSTNYDGFDNVGAIIIDHDTSIVTAMPKHWRNALKPQGRSAKTLTLSAHGATDYTVVLPAVATTQDQKAAADLCAWLKVMTGSRFPVVSETADTKVTGRFISIGRTSLASTHGFSDANLGTEGYAIEVAGANLFLLGGSRRGPINAVYALLEEDLGCRWYHRDASTIPHIPDLHFRPVPRRFVPVLEIRDPYYWDAFDATWSLRNRTSSTSIVISENYGGNENFVGGFFCHTFAGLLPADRYFKDHPEYFAENDGKRNAHQLCVTNPDVLQLVIARVKEILKNNPNAELISVSQNDGPPCGCACPNCKRITDAEGSLAGPLLIFVNGVADAIAPDFPNVKVSTLAYTDTFLPPKTVKPRPNVVIQLCTDRHAWATPFLTVTETEQFQAAMKGWAAIGARIHIWDYTVNFSGYSLPMPNMPVVTPDIRFYIAHNAQGVMLQGAYQSPGSDNGPMRSWVWGKQLWNPALDTQALMRDFIYGYYAEAAAPIWEYNKMLWDMWETYHDRPHPLGTTVAGNPIMVDMCFLPEWAPLSKDFLKRSFRLFSEAEALAKDPEVLRRVKLAKLPVMYVKLSQDIGYPAYSMQLQAMRIGDVPMGRATDGTDYGALIAEFEQVVKSEGITHFAEGAPGAEQKIAFWRETFTLKLPKVMAQRLGDVWKFKPDADAAGVPAKWYAPEVSDADWAEVRSDQGHGWEKQGFPNYLGYGWYRQTFQVPQDFGSGKLSYMLFGAVDEDAEIWINGQKAFAHTSASTGLKPVDIWATPFMFDPRPFLNPGKENLIAVRVLNTLGMGGVWKPVYFVSTDVESNPMLIMEVIQKPSM